jgi:pimeloyl-ACP methyl ester carboxylesterase
MAASPVPDWPLPEGVKSEGVNGYPLGYLERGAGVPVVFVHGSALDYRWFGPQMEPFGALHRALAVSLRHCYPEPWRGDGEFSVDQHALNRSPFSGRHEAR